ncbi:DgyrCDS1702 [Dimorphilus gyrociliatus]|uniref:DgyrCDS1702 n=1 Tax=Dimorphilus gyrociliatus TaxID=2664684 RepID=A0A7I8V9K2_9ANNE|nr:DgyrCDS1702 [Dimorphilus gyrociliatus]
MEFHKLDKYPRDRRLEGWDLFHVHPDLNIHCKDLGSRENMSISPEKYVICKEKQIFDERFVSKWHGELSPKYTFPILILAEILGRFLPFENKCEIIKDNFIIPYINFAEFTGILDGFQSENLFKDLNGKNLYLFCNESLVREVYDFKLPKSFKPNNLKEIWNIYFLIGKKTPLFKTNYKLFETIAYGCLRQYFLTNIFQVFSESDKDQNGFLINNQKVSEIKNFGVKWIKSNTNFQDIEYVMINRSATLMQSKVTAQRSPITFDRFLLRVIWYTEMLNTFLWQFSIFDKDNDRILRYKGKDHKSEVELINTCGLPELIEPLKKTFIKGQDIDRQSWIEAFYKNYANYDGHSINIYEHSKESLKVTPNYVGLYFLAFIQLTKNQLEKAPSKYFLNRGADLSSGKQWNERKSISKAYKNARKYLFKLATNNSIETFLKPNLEFFKKTGKDKVSEFLTNIYWKKASPCPI